MNLVRAVKSTLDLVFPSHCAGCAAMLPPGRMICEACEASLVPLDESACCPCCLDAIGAGLCERCRLEPPPFERVHAPLAYGGSVKDAIHRLKFGNAPWAAEALVHMAWPTIPDAWSELDVLVPVPLHAARHRERGYNQAKLLCTAISRRTGLEVADHALIRVKATAPVAELPLAERVAMVADAFVAGDDGAVRGKRVALVDDVVSTSSTVRAVCGVLRSMGAKSVDVICMARGGWGAEA